MPKIIEAMPDVRFVGVLSNPLQVFVGFAGPVALSVLMDKLPVGHSKPVLDTHVSVNTITLSRGASTYETMELMKDGNAGRSGSKLVVMDESTAN